MRLEERPRKQCCSIQGLELRDRLAVSHASSFLKTVFFLLSSAMKRFDFKRGSKDNGVMISGNAINQPALN